MGRRRPDAQEREEAAFAALEKVQQCREQAAPRSEESLHALIDSLVELSAARIGQRLEEEALAAVQEAVDAARLLEQEHPGAGVGRLAMLLLNQGMLLNGRGRESAALEAEEEAVALLRQLLPKAPDRVLPFLAEALLGLGVTQERLGQGEAAVASSREAVALCRELVEKDPDAGRKHLSEALANLGNRLRKVGRKEELLAVLEEEVALHRELAELNPDLYRSQLALDLEQMGDLRLELGQPDEALALFEESADAYRSKGEHESVLWALARVGKKTAALCRKLGRHDEALAAEDAEAEAGRRLSERSPQEYAGHLWRELGGLEPGEPGRAAREALLVQVEDAVDLFRRRAVKRPEPFGPALAKALSVLGRLLGALGRAQEALSPALEAVQLQRASEDASPEARLELAVSMQSLAERLAALGRTADALELAQVALGHLREAGKALPSVFVDADEAECLGTLSAIHHARGQKQEALALAGEALDTMWNPFLVIPDFTAHKTGALLRHALALHEADGSEPPRALRERQAKWDEVMASRREAAGT